LVAFVENGWNIFKHKIGIDKCTMHRPFQLQRKPYPYFDKPINNCLQLNILNDKDKSYMVYSIDLTYQDYAYLDSISQTNSQVMLNYYAIEQRMNYIPESCEISLKEALIRNRFHPRNIDKWVDWGHCEPEDFE
jgi:hypothetical protein